MIRAQRDDDDIYAPANSDSIEQADAIYPGTDGGTGKAGIGGDDERTDTPTVRKKRGRPSGSGNITSNRQRQQRPRGGSTSTGVRRSDVIGCSDVNVLQAVSKSMESVDNLLMTLREDSRSKESQFLSLMECISKVGDRMEAAIKTATDKLLCAITENKTKCAGKEGDTPQNVRDAQKMHDVIKMMTLVEAVDYNKGDLLYPRELQSTRIGENTLSLTKNFMNLNSLDEAMKLLSQPIESKHTTFGVFADRGRGRGHQIIREKSIIIFLNTCPQSSPMYQLHETTSHEKGEIVEQHVNGDRFLLDTAYEHAWKEMRRKAVKDSYDAMVALSNVFYPRRDNVDVPTFPTNPFDTSSNPPISVFLLALFSMKVCYAQDNGGNTTTCRLLLTYLDYDYDGYI